MRGEGFVAALAAAQAGEEAGFAALYHEFAPSVLGFLRGRVAGEAEDVAASVWLDVARSVNRFVGEEVGFRAWLFTIVRRRMMNEFRRRSRDRTVATDPARLPDAIALDDPAQHVVDGSASVEAVALIGSVLPELQGDVVLLRVVAQLPVEDVARILNLTPGHVRVLSHRGLQTLAQHFSRDGVTPSVGPGISEVP